MVDERDLDALNEIAKMNNTSVLRYALRFFRNWCLERCASIFPIPGMRVKLHRMRGINIGKHVYIGYHVVFDRVHPEYITLEDYSAVDDHCIVSAHFVGSKLMKERGQYQREVKPIVIRRGAIVNPNSVIAKGVEIGEQAMVSAGSVVLKDVPPYTLVSGNPARIMMKLNTEPEVKKDVVK